MVKILLLVLLIVLVVLVGWNARLTRRRSKEAIRDAWAAADQALAAGVEPKVIGEIMRKVRAS